MNLFVNIFCKIKLLRLVNPLIPHQKVPCASAINYHLKSEVSITLRCQPCLTCYTALQIKNCSKSTSAIEVATMTISVMKGSHHVLPPNRHLLLSAKMNGHKGGHW